MLVKYFCGALMVPDNMEYAVYYDDSDVIIETSEKIYTLECDGGDASYEWSDILTEELLGAYKNGRTYVDLMHPRNLDEANAATYTRLLDSYSVPIMRKAPVRISVKPS